MECTVHGVTKNSDTTEQLSLSLFLSHLAAREAGSEVFTWTSKYIFPATKDWVIIIIHVSSLLLFL